MTTSLGLLRSVTNRLSRDLLDALGHASASAARAVAGRHDEAEVARRLAAFMTEASPFYTLPDGRQVRVAAGFRISTEEPPGRRAPAVLLPRLLQALPAAARRELRGAAVAAVWGRATPRQVQALTQALISAGRLEELRGRVGRPIGDFQAVRWLQTEHGIGIDCAGYVRQAYEAAVRQRGHGLPGSQVGGLASNPRFVRVTRPEETRVGDLIDLGAPSRARPGDYLDPSRHLRSETSGHFAIVAGRGLLGPAEARALGAPADFAGPRVHLFRVHSSWGGSRISPRGGAAERLWLYDPDSRRWAQVEPGRDGRPRVVPSAHRTGPVDHPLDGIFRSR